MSRLKLGQRVKKVRGMCVGTTGTVVEFDPDEDFASVGVRVDQGGVGCWGDVWDTCTFIPGDVVWAAPEELEPILDQHQPCDAEFKADLDRLLEREGVRA